MEILLMAARIRKRVIPVYKYLTGTLLIFLTGIFLLFTSQVKSQKVNLTGLYFGGMSHEGNLNGIGYYYLKNDSTFLFFNTSPISDKRVSRYLKNNYTDTIESFGKGRWRVSDSLLVFQFEQVDNFNIYNDTIKCICYAKYPYDSLHLKIHVITPNKKNTGFEFISFPNTYKGVATDIEGNANVVLPLSYSKFKMKLLKYGFMERAFVFQPSSNACDFTIILNENSKDAVYKNSSSNRRLNMIPEFSFGLKYKIKPDKRVVIQQLTKEDGGIDVLKTIIRTGYSRFPEQKYFLDTILKVVNEIKKEE